MTMKPLFKRSPHKLHLEMWTSRSRWSVRDYMLLALGAIVLLAVAADYMVKAHRLAKLEAVSGHQMTMRSVSDMAKPEEVQAVQQLIERLSFTWSSLFNALESAKSDGVVLLSLEPDAARHAVTIVAQAADVYGMLQYMHALKQQPRLREVTLVEHEMQQDVVDQPTKFTVTAVWVE